LRFSRLISCCISFSLILSAAPAPAASAVRSAEPDWGAVAGGYPAPGSPAAREELATLHRLQDQRTPADVDRILRESHPDLGLFLDAIGGSDPSDYPATQALLKQAKRDLKPVVAALKDRFRRIPPCTRPWTRTAASASPASTRPWAPCLPTCSSGWIRPTPRPWPGRAG